MTKKEYELHAAKTIEAFEKAGIRITEEEKQKILFLHKGVLYRCDRKPFRRYRGGTDMSDLPHKK